MEDHPASRITINFLNSTFHPVYTHQCFRDGESLPRNLSLSINLAPSCRKCSVIVQSTDEPMPILTSTTKAAATTTTKERAATGENKTVERRELPFVVANAPSAVNKNQSLVSSTDNEPVVTPIDNSSGSNNNKTRMEKIEPTEQTAPTYSDGVVSSPSPSRTAMKKKRVVQFMDSTPTDANNNEDDRSNKSHPASSDNQNKERTCRKRVRFTVEESDGGTFSKNNNNNDDKGYDTTVNQKNGTTEAGKGDGVLLPHDNNPRVLSMNEIMERVQRALPPIVYVRRHSTNNTLEEEKDTPATTTTASSLSTPFVQDELSMMAVGKSVEEAYLSKPIGVIVHKYKRKMQNQQLAEEEEEESTFVLCLANGDTRNEQVVQYHNQIQPLALFFIETADGVNLTSNEGGGYWKVLYLFRVHTCDTTSVALDADNNIDSASNMTEKEREEEEKNRVRYSLVGYMTLFHFYSPFKKPEGGIVLRICQAVILPPYQRCGHGKQMLKTVYEYASGAFDSITTNNECSSQETAGMMKQDIVEVNAEDPAPAFVALRNRVDYELLMSRCCQSARTLSVKDDNSPPLISPMYWGRINTDESSSSSNNKEEYDGLTVTDESFFKPLPESEAIAAGAALRITSKQIHIAYELYKLYALMTFTDKLDASECVKVKHDQKEWIETEKQTLEKRFRLMVKKRLLKMHREEIDACPNKVEKQAKLMEIYHETENQYRLILGKR